MPASLPRPLNALIKDISGLAGRLTIYASPTPAAGGVPLLLIHSVNAAASAYEVKPLFDHYSRSRSVYAFELPGFGHSDRSDRAYTVRLMTDAVVDVAAEIGRAYGGPIDVIALSLSCEFLARAAYEKPELFRSLGLISPTGFEGKARDEAGGTRGKEWLRRTLDFPAWGQAMFKLLSTRPVIRKFLEKTWGSKNIDEGLLEYDYLTTHQTGARHAPYYFVSGFLFSKDILNVYDGLRRPVWMVHGTRGDFVDYHHKKRIKARTNWSVNVLQTGAFPQFENLAELTASYDGFTANLESPRSNPKAL